MPLFTEPLRHIRRDDPVGSLVFRCIESGISLHTLDESFYSCPGGFDDLLTEGFGLQKSDPLLNAKSERLCKFIVFAPESAAELVMQAASDAGAGNIGAYTHCSFQTRGKGSFPPGQGANPVIGRVGSLEYAEEVKLEMVTPESIIGCVIEAVIGIHPYEDVAYDIIPLSNPGEKRGRGRIGELESKAPLSSLLQIIREKFPECVIRQSGCALQLVGKLSIASGGGVGIYREAIRRGANVHITGIASVADWALADGSSTVLVEIGVAESVSEGLIGIKERLETKYSGAGIKVIVGI